MGLHFLLLYLIRQGYDILGNVMVDDDLSNATDAMRAAKALNADVVVGAVCLLGIPFTDS